MCLHIISDLFQDEPCDTPKGKDLEIHRFAVRQVHESLRRLNVAKRYGVVPSTKILFMGHHHC